MPCGKFENSATVIAVAVLFCGRLASPAQAIDLSQPYGDMRGCAFRLDMEYSEEFMLLLTATEMTSTVSLCTFTKTETNEDGSLKLSASCAEEGEAGETPATFTVKQGETNDTLVILNEDDTVFGEVALCT